MNYVSINSKRRYLILPKKEYDQSEAVKYASRFWHCRTDEVILSGAKKKNADEFYVERPFDYGNYWCLHRGCKTDTEYLVKWLKGSHEVARKEQK